MGGSHLCRVVASPATQPGTCMGGENSGGCMMSANTEHVTESHQTKNVAHRQGEEAQIGISSLN